MAKSVITMFLLILALSGMNAKAQSQKYSLQQCLDFAVNNSYSLHRAKLDIEAAEYQKQEVRAGILPQINVQGNVDDNVALSKMMLPGEILGQPEVQIPVEMGTKYVLDASVHAEQVIFDPALFIGIKMAQNGAELQKLHYRMTKEELIYNVSMAYYEIVSKVQELANLRYMLSKQDTLYLLMQRRVDEDLTREVDLNRVRVNLTNLKVRSENICTTIAQQKKYLQILIGMPITEAFDLDHTVLSELPLPSTDPFVLPANKVEMDILYKENDLLHLEMKQQKAGYLPRLSAFVSGGYQMQSGKLNLSEGPWYSSAVVGLRLSVPVFDGFRKRNQVKQTRMRIRKLETGIAETQQTIRTNYENAAAQLAVAYQSVKAQDENLQLAEKVYAQTALLYAEGLASLTDLLETETSLREAQTLHVSEIVRYKKAEIDLMKAEGTLENLIKHSIK